MSSASFCGHCGNQINAGYSFCSKCGKSIKSESLTPKAAKSTPKVKFLSRRSNIIIVALIALFILSVAAWQNTESESESTPETELYYDPAEVIRYQECLDNGQGAFGGGAAWDKFTCRSYEPKLKIRNKQ